MTSSFTPQILPDRAIIRLTGEFVLAFLQNLITAEVSALPEGQSAYGGLLSPQGKIQHELFVFNGGDAVFLDCVGDQRGALMQKLILYRLRAKISIDADDSQAVAVGGSGPADPRTIDMGARALVPAGSLPTGDGYDAARLALGLPDGAADIGQNEHFPHEANFDFLHGVSFDKGCFVGQEVVSRMRHRGTARSRMLPITFDASAVARGETIRSGETQIGTVLSSRGEHAMALIRLDRLAEATLPLKAGNVRFHVRKPSWMALDLVVPEVAL